MWLYNSYNFVFVVALGVIMNFILMLVLDRKYNERISIIEKRLNEIEKRN